MILRGDNFTPTTRTPWGGRRIVEKYKTTLAMASTVVGESWELSVEPDFPSVGRETGESLSEVIAREPDRWLGREMHDGRRSTGLLVKLLDAADELSVQIHPRDDYSGLREDQSGKPECWYVVESTPGAGVYLGLADGVTRETLQEVLRAEGDVSQCLGFVECVPGDFLLIEAGTAHAIGRGLTLVEPQRVLPAKRGVTYRYWDWNRRYDKDGKLDERGFSRELHVEDALAVTDWEAPRGEEFLRRARVRAGEAEREEHAVVKVLCARDREREGGLKSDELQVARVSGTGKIDIPRWGVLRALTVLEGAVTVDGVTVGRGETAAIAAELDGAMMQLHSAHAVLSAVY